MRLTLKKCLLSIFFITLLIVGYFSLQLVNLVQIRDLLFDTEKFDLESLKQDNLRIKQDIHYSNYLFSGYNNFTKEFTDLDKIKQLPINEKCEIIFNQWNKFNPDWRFRTWNHRDERYDKSSDKKMNFSKIELMKYERNLKNLSLIENSN